MVGRAQVPLHFPLGFSVLPRTERDREKHRCKALKLLGVRTGRAKEDIPFPLLVKQLPFLRKQLLLHFLFLFGSVPQGPLGCAVWVCLTLCQVALKLRRLVHICHLNS